ncbi:MAG: hypothetical protein WCG93_00560 [Paludibacter sp.]
MAIIKGFLQMTGSIKGVSFYSVRGSDKVIMRTKGVPARIKLPLRPSSRACGNNKKSGADAPSLARWLGMPLVG